MGGTNLENAYVANAAGKSAPCTVEAAHDRVGNRGACWGCAVSIWAVEGLRDALTEWLSTPKVRAEGEQR